MSIRTSALAAALDKAQDASRKSHERLFETLYVDRDGSIDWSMSPDHADRSRSLYRLLHVGSGDRRCNCDTCSGVWTQQEEDGYVVTHLGYDPQEWDKDEEAQIRADYRKQHPYASEIEAAQVAAANTDLSDYEQQIECAFALIPNGYFDDEYLAHGQAA